MPFSKIELAMLFSDNGLAIVRQQGLRSLSAAVRKEFRPSGMAACRKSSQLHRLMGGFPRPLNPKWVDSRQFHLAGKMHILRNNSILQNYLYFYNNGLYLAILLAESTPASGTLVMRREASPRCIGDAVFEQHCNGGELCFRQ